MTAGQKYFGIALLSVSCAFAQDTGTAIVESVKASRQSSSVRVEITLSLPVTPSIATASNPDRILLDLPGTICSNKTRNVAVNINGVLRVRTGQHSTDPIITRVVVDLSQEHTYFLKQESNRLVLSLVPADNARRSGSHGAPVAATSGNLIGVFRRRHPSSTGNNNSDVDDLSSIPAAPATVGPPFDPTASVSKAADASAVRPAAPVAQNSSTLAASNLAGQASADHSQNSDVAKTAPTSSSSVRPAPVVSADSADSPGETAQTTSNEDFAIAAGANEEKNLKAVDSAESSASSMESTSDSVAHEATVIARSDDPGLRTVFRVKYVAEGVAYLEGGHAQGLAEGMKLEIEDTNLPAKQGDSASASDPRVIAELTVSAVAETSAVADIASPKRPVKVGDLAYLSSADADALVQQRALSATRQYPAVISFTEGDTLDEEALAEVPRPPLPSVNRARGRIGFDTMETVSHGTSTITSTDMGVDFRGDITRIGGTYWNLSGYWRGRLTKESAISQQTLQNLINRTYHLNMTYDNPNSNLVAGFGRLYLPWAQSLDTIDGGYFGKRLKPGVVLGIFGGSTPDPSSWDYSPNRAISGMFINFEGGEYNGFHYSSTSGAGVSMVNWAIDRPFVFVEESLSYNRTFALYEAAQFDSPQGNSATASPGAGLGRNFFTFRASPQPRVELDFNYNYFRDIPTFDPTLVGTGLLDKFLFQGFSAGGRVEVFKQIWLSTTLGRSSGTGDPKPSLNEMYGITFNRLPIVQLRMDAHYASFNSSFGTGSYESISISRQLSERLRLEALLGQQNFSSTLTSNTRGRFLTGTVETTLGPHYYLQGSFTTNRGDMSYDQVMFSVGYRFDSKRRGE
jgi:hypothetical protein